MGFLGGAANGRFRIISDGFQNADGFGRFGTQTTQLFNGSQAYLGDDFLPHSLDQGRDGVHQVGLRADRAWRV